MPVSVRRALDAYTHWVGQLNKSSGRRSPSTFLKKWGWQIALNLLLIAGVFIGAFYARRFALQKWPDAPGGDNAIKGMVWVGAMLLSLPMIIAVVRKWQAFAMLLSEMSVTRISLPPTLLTLGSRSSRRTLAGPPLKFSTVRR